MDAMSVCWVAADVICSLLTAKRISVGAEDTLRDRPYLCYHTVLHAVVLVNKAADYGIIDTPQWVMQD